jgi:RimJ/RimL family protein N-acetyltransferase
MMQLTTHRVPDQAPVVLRDGARVPVRPLERGDRAELAAMVGRLSERSRYLRFAAPKPRLTSRELDHLVDVDHHRNEALVAIDPDTGDGIAIVRWISVAGEPGVAEIAVTVADEWQGRGLGPTLLARLVGLARAEGLTALRASVLAVNARSIAMLRRAGFRVTPVTGALLEYELPLTPDDGASAA